VAGYRLCYNVLATAYRYHGGPQGCPVAETLCQANARLRGAGCHSLIVGAPGWSGRRIDQDEGEGSGIMKIYTRTGDQGDTGLLGGVRVRKSHPVIRACGTLDETNSIIGMARSNNLPEDLDLDLSQVQKDLFVIGATVAEVLSDNPRSKVRLPAGRWKELETLIDTLDKDLPELDAFVIPGGDPPAAILYWARSVCRRAEAELVHVIDSHQIETGLTEELIFLNRLSDLLFVMARTVNHRNNYVETRWLPDEVD